MKVSGIIKRIDDLELVGEKQFKKRTFSLEINPQNQYPELALMECNGDKNVPLLDTVNVGDSVEVDFDFKGRDWENKTGKTVTFNCLSAWKISRLGTGSQPAQPAQQMSVPAEPDNDLPF